MLGPTVTNYVIDAADAAGFVYGRSVLRTVGQKGPSLEQSFAFEAFESEFLRQQDIPLRKLAAGYKAPLRRASTVNVELIDIDGSKISDHIATSGVATDYLETAECIELRTLCAAEMRAQEFIGSLLG